jgi:predicted permease
VESSAFTCCLPVDGQFGLPFAIAGHPVDPSKGQQGAGWMQASPDFYKVFRIPILRGREFTDADTGSSPGVVIINEAFEKQYFAKENPIGQQILIAKGMGPPFEEPGRQIVGVVGNTHDGGLDQDTPPLMIVPDSQVLDAMTALNAKIVPLRWAVRTHGDPKQLSAAIAEQLRQASGGFPVAHIRSMDEVVSRTTSRQTFNMMLLSIFGAIALVLAAIGIYGLIAYSVQQRTQEIGIRMALGADRTTIRRLVVWDGMRLTLIGMVLGIGASFGLTRLIASFLFGVKTWDPTAFIAVPLVLAAVALAAVWLPAMRASRVEPMMALRVE